jgi:hypothetical protein
MWMFLSRRIRTWLVLAVALPAMRTLVHKVAIREQRRSPETTPARLLGRADSALTAVSGRAMRGRRT